MSSPLGDLDSRVSWKYWGWADKYPRTNTILRQHTRPGLPGSRARVAEIGQQRRCAKPGITAVRDFQGPRWPQVLRGAVSPTAQVSTPPPGAGTFGLGAGGVLEQREQGSSQA